MKRHKREETVLVAVLKRKRDLRVLLTERWYRIPMAHLPKRRFLYIAFYQPAVFGRDGKRIRYYARVKTQQTLKRIELLPNEYRNPRASELYRRIHVGVIQQLSAPIRNTTPRRVIFGFTTLRRLKTARNILELYNIAPTEEMIASALTRAGIQAKPQHIIVKGARRYRLDFALFCTRGAIAVECDNTKAHSGKRRQAKDALKDAFLAENGWTVLRLSEQDIVSDIGASMMRITKTIRQLGGIE